MNNQKGDENVKPNEPKPGSFEYDRKRRGWLSALGKQYTNALNKKTGVNVLGHDMTVRDTIDTATTVIPTGAGLRAAAWAAKGIGRAAKAFKAYRAERAARAATTGTRAATTGTRATVRTGKLARVAKKASNIDLPNFGVTNALSTITGAARKATKKNDTEEETVKEAYRNLGMTLLEKSAAWTRSEGKNPSGGLNAKGVASYRAQNPGSKLKTAVTTKPSKLKKGSKAAKRRKSFCARMKGMRKRQKSSNNTGKDRLSLSLKKWNC